MSISKLVSFSVSFPVLRRLPGENVRLLTAGTRPCRAEKYEALYTDCPNTVRHDNRSGTLYQIGTRLGVLDRPCETLTIWQGVEFTLPEMPTMRRSQRRRRQDE